MLYYNASLAAAATAFPTISCPVETAVATSVSSYNISKYPLLMQNRLQRAGRGLWLDGQPMLLRAICYSPVPVGQDPGYGEPWGDYL